MFHAFWRLIRKYPHLAVLISGVALSAGVVTLDHHFATTQNRLIESHVKPTGMHAVYRYIVEIHVCVAQVYAPVAGGTFSLGVGIGLLGIYLMVRPHIVAWLRGTNRPPDAP